MNKYQKIKIIRDELNLSQKEFSKKLGIGLSTLGMLEVGKREILNRHINLICKTFNVNEDWLRNDVEPIFKENNKEKTLIELLEEEYSIKPIAKKIIENYLMLDEKEQLIFERFAKKLFVESSTNFKENSKYTIKEKIKNQDLKQVKFYEIPASAGIGSLITEDVPFEIKEIDLITIPHARKADFALYVRGDSMEPNFYDGDVVFIKEQPYIEEGQIGIFIYENESYIKKYTTDKNGQVYLVSLNPKYEPIKISENNCFKICGVVL